MRLKTVSFAVATTLLASMPFSFSAVAEDNSFDWSANVSLVSDYRFRGLSLSSKDFAIQGGFDLSSSTGFYVGTWGSTIESFAGSETELDIYAGYSNSIGDLTYDVGILAYTYPGSSDTYYLEGYGSIAGTVKGVDWKVGLAYAFDQDNLGGNDNLYIYTDFGYAIPDTDFSLSSHFARETGAFGKAPSEAKWDWNVGVAYAVNDKISLSAQYVDTNVNGIGSAGAVFSLSASF